MDRFNRLAHAVCECKYHLVWYSKYKFRVLTEVESGSYENCNQRPLV